MNVIILAGVFFGTLLLMMSLYAFFNRGELAASDAARARLRARAEAGGRQLSILRDDRASELPFLNRLLVGRELTHRLADELARAGSARRPGEFILASVAGAVVGLLLGQSFGALPALGIGAFGLVLPYILMRRAQRKRLAKFEEQLPEALDMLVNALKAGYSLQAGMEFVGKESAAPLGPEFARFYDEQRLGVDVREALLNLQARVGTADVKMFVTSLLIQRETGGNLGEILTNISNLMRERVAFRGQVATLTAEPKMSARILSALPFAAFLILSLMNREFMRPLFTTTTGKMFAAYAMVSVIIGYFVMMKIADIDI